MPRKTRAAISSAVLRVGPAALVLEGEHAPALGVDVPVAGEVDDVRPALGHESGQLVDAAGLGEVGDDLPLHVGRGPEHQVFFPLVIELVLVDRGRGQEQHPERAGPGGTGGRVHLAERGPPERPAGIAADRQAGDDFDQLPRQVEDHWVVGLEDQVAWAGGVQNRLEVVAGGGQPGVEKSPAHRTEVFRVGHRPASPVIEEVEEPFAHVKDGLRLQAGDGDGITNRRSIDGPTRCPGGRRIGRLDPEGQGGHRDAPRGDADAFSAATGGRSSTSASSKTIGADRPAQQAASDFKRFSGGGFRVGRLGQH